MARLGLRAIKKPNLTGSFDEPIEPIKEVVLEVEKPQTNWEQTPNKLQTETQTNREQTGNKSGTGFSETGNKPLTKPQTQPKTNREQTGNKSGTKTGFSTVVGLQRKILDLLFEKAQLAGSLSTGNVFADQLAESLACSGDTVRTSLKRLERKGFLIRTSFKAGRGGFSVFDIEISTYQDLAIGNKLGTNREQIGNKPQTKPQTETQTNAPNSSSNDLNIKKETTIPVPENLRAIISQREIQRLLEKGASEEDLRQSLDHFSYDLENNLVRSKTTPTNLFFGLLRSGQRYKSIHLLEQETTELKAYQAELERVEAEKKQLDVLRLRDKYEEYKKSNPNFLEKIKSETKQINLTDDLADKVGFSRFTEEQQRTAE